MAEKEIWEFNFDSDDNEIVSLLQRLMRERVGITERLGERKDISINYAMQLLAFKQQQKLFNEQRDGNRGLVRSTKWLVYATMLLAIITALTVYFTYRTYELSNTANSIEYTLKMQDELNSNQFKGIEDTINYGDQNTQLISTQPNKVLFTQSDIENYIDDLDTIGSLVKEDVIFQQTAYDAFSIQVEMAWCNKDVQGVIAKDRTNDKSASSLSDPIYSDFEYLAKIFLAKDGACSIVD
jgi:hypothetical protein